MAIAGPDHYRIWNHGLVDAIFPAQPDQDNIEEITSIPVGLSILKGIRKRWGDPVEGTLEAFNSSLRCEFGRRRENTHELLEVMHRQSETWTSDSETRPPFFAFLWALCLVASGFPENVGSFRHRLRKLIAEDVQFGVYSPGQTEEQDVNLYWNRLAAWLRKRRGYELWLPPISWKRHVARAYGLVFPDAFDRRALADALRERGLLGIDPPVKPVVDAIKDQLQDSEAFSGAFHEAFLEFANAYDQGRIDPSEHPVWLSIQREIKNPSPDRDRGRSLSGTTLVGWQDEGPLSLAIASKEPQELESDDLVFQKADYPLAGYDYFLESAAGDEPVGRLLDGRLDDVGSLHALTGQGVLFFNEVGPSEYSVATGAAISEAPLALVRQDRLSGFLEEFGGSTGYEVRDQWTEVWEFTARYSEELPSSLEGVTQLIKPTVPRSIGLSGGVRIYGNTYLALGHLLPVARADWAKVIECQWDSTAAPCDLLDDGSWRLPRGVARAAPVSVTLIGRDNQGEEITRELDLIETVDAYEFRTTDAGVWWLEGHQIRDMVQRGTIRLPFSYFGMASSSPDDGDFLHLGPSVLHLGRRVGEFAQPDQAALHIVGLRTGLGRHWCVVTELGREGPVAEAAEDEGSNRAWRKSIVGEAEAVYVRTSSDAYERMTESQSRLDDYRRVARRHDLSKSHSRGSRPETLDWVQTEEPAISHRVLDAIRGLASLASRKTRVPIQEVLAIMVPEERDDSADADERRHDLRDLSFLVLRSWQEAGLLDVLRPQEYGPPLVVARSPRLAAVRRGPVTEAVLIGLCTPTVTKRFASRASQFCDVGYLKTAGIHAPAIVRVMTEDPEALNELSVELGHGETMWTQGTLDPRLVSASTRTQDPQDDRYRVTGRFCLDGGRLRFLKATETPPPNRVEIRHYAHRPAMYATIRDGVESSFSVFRIHAFLDLARATGTAAFVEDGGTLTSAGPVPHRLPLPIARLSVLMGGGVPGPRFVNYQLRDYRYPFGGHLMPKVRELLGEELLSGGGTS